MMASRVTGAGSILLEAHDLTLPTGTGIATYARVLDEALRTLGYQTEALIGAARGFNRKDPTLSEIAFYEEFVEFPRIFSEQPAVESKAASRINNTTNFVMLVVHN